MFDRNTCLSLQISPPLTRYLISFQFFYVDDDRIAEGSRIIEKQVQFAGWKYRGSCRAQMASVDRKKGSGLWGRWKRYGATLISPPRIKNRDFVTGNQWSDGLCKFNERHGHASSISPSTIWPFFRPASLVSPRVGLASPRKSSVTPTTATPSLSANPCFALTFAVFVWLVVDSLFRYFAVVPRFLLRSLRAGGYIRFPQSFQSLLYAFLNDIWSFPELEFLL